MCEKFTAYAINTLSGDYKFQEAVNYKHFKLTSAVMFYDLQKKTIEIAVENIFIVNHGWYLHLKACANFHNEIDQDNKYR
ncbi:hypothetical protein E2320_002310 [Naja naja]|nr:hypothetical protein E2320_002310 [Naja naja]